MSRARVGPGDLVVDLGAGDGAITARLLRAGAEVVAVELHEGRARGLRQRFTSDQLSVVRVDLERFRFPHRPFQVVANPPYALSVAVVRRLLHETHHLRRADVVLQRRMVEHLLERPPRAGAWWRTFEMSRGATVPRQSFRPTTRVDSAVLTIVRR